MAARPSLLVRRVAVVVAAAVVATAALLASPQPAHALPDCPVRSSADAFWVDLAYTRLFDRCADDGGLAFALARLDAGMSRKAVVVGLQRSAEGRRAWVRTWYQRILERTPSASEAAGWDATVLGGNHRALMVPLMASNELFVRAGATTRDWVSVVFFVAFDRVAEPADLDYWDAFLTAGASRSSVAAEMLRRRPSAEGVVGTFTYVLVLRREADPAGLAAWTDTYLARPDLRAIQAAVLASTEAYALAQPKG